MTTPRSLRWEAGRRMEFELWWLLPIMAVFFALGWIAARIDIKHLLRESRALPLSYFRGLNFLLNEQPDKAIESFIEVVKVDPQTIDLHFALGLAVPAPGRDRPRDPHAPEPARPPRPAGRQAHHRDSTSWRRISIARDCSTAPRSCSPSVDGTTYEHAVARPSDLDLRDREGLGAKAIAATQRMEAARQAAVLQGDRAVSLRARAGGAAARTTPSSRRREIDAGARRRTAPARAPTCCAGDLHAQRGDLARRRRSVAADRIAESRVPGARRRSFRRRLSASSATCATGIRLLRNYQIAVLRRSTCLNALFSLVLEHEGADAPPRRW